MTRTYALGPPFGGAAIGYLLAHRRFAGAILAPRALFSHAFLWQGLAGTGVAVFALLAVSAEPAAGVKPTLPVTAIALTYRLFPDTLPVLASLPVFLAPEHI